MVKGAIMYSISEVANMFDLPVSTLRYYDKEGLFPNLKRVSGIRKFSDNEIEALRVIECLKKSGLEIKEIKQFMDWCQEGASTFEKRRELLGKRREVLKAEMAEMERNMDMLNFKCWYYDTAIKDGTDEKVLAMFPDKFPNEIQELYNKTHKI